MKLENDLRKKITLYQTLFNNGIAMATMEVPWDWFVFKMKAYYYIVKVTKFALCTVYRFSTAEGRSSLWADSTPCLFRVKLFSASTVTWGNHIRNV